MPDVRIVGNGLAACCCAALLKQAGFRIFVDAAGRGPAPILMLSGQTQRLLTDVLGPATLFQTLAPVTKRMVAWGPNRETIVLPHSGLVVNESLLLEDLWRSLEVRTDDDYSPDCWQVFSAKSALPPVSQRDFGSRQAFTYSVQLRAHADAGACSIEATEDGWLFLLPVGNNGGSLISVGAEAEVLLPKSSLIAGQIGSFPFASGHFAAYPRIVTPLCGPGWLACGSAAVAFDPIAGEGAGNALREGILASAVIRAAQSGGDTDALLQHYSNRIFSGFLRHLAECIHFYQQPGGGAWWRRELDPMREGLHWVRSEVASHAGEQFRLVGFELVQLNNR
jgi:2-polyprenyl-6-methoxyphenol hydroxylase-like FAD-dependent oxidoreductase